MVGEGFLGKTVGVIDQLLPQTEAGRKITRQMILPAIFVYVARILMESVMKNERSFGSTSLYWLICATSCLIDVFLTILVIWIGVRSAKLAQHVAPALVLIGGLALALYLPLPPLPTSPYPEEAFFAAHRADFEQVVALAQQDGLACITRLGCDSQMRDLPTEYKDITVDGSVMLRQMGQEQTGLVLEFWPLEWVYPVVYFENEVDRTPIENMDIDCNDSRWVRKLAEHWYLCIYPF